MNPKGSGRVAARVSDAIRSAVALPSLCAMFEPSYHIATNLSQTGSRGSKNIQLSNLVKKGTCSQRANHRKLAQIEATALRRQRSQVRILSGAPAISTH